MKQKSSFVFVPIVWKMALWGFVAAVLMFAMAGLGLFGEMPEIEELENIWSKIVGKLGEQKFEDYLRYYWNSINKSVGKKDLFKTIKNSINNKEEVFKLIRNLDEE